MNYIQHNDTQRTSVECRYTKCRDYFNVMLVYGSGYTALLLVNISILFQYL
jgi:hypothetical protein